MNPYYLSVIIPTHNRKEQLCKCLYSLAGQNYPKENYEIIVVADRCKDGTAEVIRAMQNSFPVAISVIENGAGNAASSRNLGASKAKGDYLLFLDDDIIAGKNLIHTHLKLCGNNKIVLGYSKPVIPENPTLWQRRARRWWEDRFYQMSKKGYRFTFQDFFSGNFSIPAPLFNKMNGFNEFFNRLEDYEFGFRLIKENVKFVFSQKAIGYHHETNDLKKWLFRLRDESDANIRMCKKSPALKPILFKVPYKLYGWHKLIQKIIRKFSFMKNDSFEIFQKMILKMIALVEFMQLNSLWEKLTGVLFEYNYWRGIARSYNSEKEFYAWIENEKSVGVKKDFVKIDIKNLLKQRSFGKIVIPADKKIIKLSINQNDLIDFHPVEGSQKVTGDFIQYFLKDHCQKEFTPVLANYILRNQK